MKSEKDAPEIYLKEATIARHELKITDDDFYQAGELYRRVLSDTDKDHLISNIAGHLGNALKRIQYRQTALFYKADSDYGTRVANALSLDINKVIELSNISDVERTKATEIDME